MANISAVACCTLEKLLSEFQKFFPAIDTLSSVRSHSGSSLNDDLCRGLLNSLDDKRYNSSPSKPYASSSVSWVLLLFFLNYNNLIF